MIKLNPDYSTTRLVTREVPIIEEPPDAAFKTVLLLPQGKGRQGEGGLRTQGYFKRSLPDKPLITVITVVFNGAQYLEETILSVIGQTYDNVEYIIIDGGSTDGTLDIIRKYEHAVDYWVSENDGGIYDAMNKGIDAGTGEWINFMNAGDWFYSNQIVLSIFDKKKYDGVQVIYGDCEIQYPTGRKRIATAGNLKNLWKGSQFSHQSSFISLYYQKLFRYNLSNAICGDYELFYTVARKKWGFIYIQIVISSISTGGISDVNRIESIVGRWNIIEKNDKVNFYYIWLIIKETLKEKIKVLLCLEK